MPAPTPAQDVSARAEFEECISAGGPTGELILSLNWSATPLGAIGSWPLGLKMTIASMLRSHQPMLLWWGPELIQLYNDAYRATFFGEKHPAAMGQRGEDCWHEFWPRLLPRIQEVMSRGQASWDEDRFMPICRSGRIEEAYWTCGYSPVYDEQFRVAGTLLVSAETTGRVLAARRHGVIRRLSSALATCEDVRSVADQTLRLISECSHDIPFAFECRSTSEKGSFAVVRSVPLDCEGAAWLESRVLAVLAEQGAHPVSGATVLRLPEETSVAAGPWPEPTTEVAVIRCKRPPLGAWIFG
ncbi:MAG TPA: PAS domain-containing protein, partial [Polyangiaceae bacterium]